MHRTRGLRFPHRPPFFMLARPAVLPFSIQHLPAPPLYIALLRQSEAHPPYFQSLAHSSCVYPGYACPPSFWRGPKALFIFLLATCLPRSSRGHSSLATKSFRFRTYSPTPRLTVFCPQPRAAKSRRIRTYKNPRCKSFRIRTYEKKQGRGASPLSNSPPCHLRPSKVRYSEQGRVSGCCTADPSLEREVLL